MSGELNRHIYEMGRRSDAWRKVRLAVIAARDFCGICGNEVDKTLRWPDPGSPTVDHVVPLADLAATGGNPLDPSNLRLAHLGCNSRRGAKQATRKRRTKKQGVPSRPW